MAHHRQPARKIPQGKCGAPKKILHVRDNEEESHVERTAMMLPSHARGKDARAVAKGSRQDWHLSFNAGSQTPQERATLGQRHHSMAGLAGETPVPSLDLGGWLPMASRSGFSCMRGKSLYECIPPKISTG